MVSSNTINTLTRVSVKPTIWVVRQDPDGCYRISATYLHPERGEFFEIVTARDETKIYKTIKAAMHDIRRVMASPMIQVHFHD